MGRRRKPYEIAREKRTQWITYGQSWYAQYQACSSCGEVSYCHGKTPNKMKCKTCHFGPYLEIAYEEVPLEI